MEQLQQMAIRNTQLAKQVSNLRAKLLALANENRQLEEELDRLKEKHG